MGDDRDSLARLRREIDQIDDQLHDLLMRRTQIVRQVAAAKALDAGADEVAPHGVQALAMRPDREARVIRRLVSRHQGELPLLVIVRLWRELMTAKTRLQAPLSVQVFVGDAQAIGYWDLARFYYGSPTPLIGCENTEDVLKAVDADPSMIGILPAPESAPSPWWTGLKSICGDSVNIVARLPFVTGGEQPLDFPCAYVIAPIAPEDTGDDRTVLRIQSNQSVTQPELERVCEDAGLIDAAHFAHGSDERSMNWLFDVAGFCPEDDAAVTALRASAVITSVDVLGSFANPLDLDDVGDGK